MWRRLATAATLLVLTTTAPSRAAVAEEPAPHSDEEAAVLLVERFAPILMLKQQSAPCETDGEAFAPTPVDIVLDNPEVVLRQVGRDDPVVMRAPGASDLAGLGQGFFLDFPGSSLAPGCIYERDFDKYTADTAPTVYAHVVQQPDEPDLVFVQYWFYWYYNDWNNKHESDWEGITLKFEASSIAEALASEPVAVGYSQHEGGERADWSDGKLSKDGDHPIVYSSAGSHASYFGSALYLGRAANEGFGCDNTDGPSTRVVPEVRLLPDSVDDAADPLAWLSYEGRWGERQNGAFNGPTGPAVKDRWLEPAPWFDELRSSSVVIPAGDSGATAVIDIFCRAVERGSGALITFTTSPARILVAGLALVILGRFLVGRTSWDAVPGSPVVRARSAGQILRSAFELYRGAPMAFALFGLVYVPAAIVTGALSALLRLVPFVSSIMSLAGQASGTSIVLAALVGGLANVAAFVVVSAAIADFLDRDRSGPEGCVQSLRRLWDVRHELFGALVRVFAIVFGLLVSFVGSPWGIRQLVRYQFVPQAVVVEGCDARAALDRSSRLVRGRWLHTGVFVAVVNAAIGLTALVVALILLLVASGLPLWVFSALVMLVYALVVPLAAIAMTLLYGDAVAQQAADPTEPDPVPAAVG